MDAKKMEANRYKGKCARKPIKMVADAKRRVEIEVF